MSRDLIITIHKKPGKAVAHKPKRGPIKPRRRRDEVDRRKTSGIFFNIYDLGQITNGAGGWITPVADLPNVGSTAAIQAILAEPLGHSVSSWKTRYRRLGPLSVLDPYHVSGFIGDYALTMLEEFASSNPKWTNKGRKITGADVPINYVAAQPSRATDPDIFYEVENCRLFNRYFDASDDLGIIKVTSLPSYAAAASPFLLTADKSIDIFWTPDIMYFVGLESGTPYTSDWKILDRPTAFASVPIPGNTADYAAERVLGPGTYTSTAITEFGEEGSLIGMIVQGASVFYLWFVS